MMRYLLLILTGVLVVATATVTVAFTPQSVPPRLSYGVHSLDAARATARAVFADIRLPVRARALSHLSESVLANLGFYAISQQSESSNEVGIWEVPLGLDETASFIEHHGSPGMADPETSIDLTPDAVGLMNGVVTFSSVAPQNEQESLRPFTRVTYDLSMTPSSPKKTQLLVGVQVYWAPTRPSSEEVPRGTHTMEITRVGSKVGDGSVVSRRSVSTQVAAVISRFGRVIRGLPVQLHGIEASCLEPDLTPDSVVYRYVLSFAPSSTTPADFVVNYEGGCSNVSLVANGIEEPPLYDASPHSMLVSKEPLSNAIEEMFSPGIPLIYSAS